MKQPEPMPYTSLIADLPATPKAKLPAPLGAASITFDPGHFDAVRWRQSVARFYNGLSTRASRRKVSYCRKRIQQRLAGMVEPRARVLEIGCGTGELLASLNPSCGVGIDLSQNTLHAARRRYSGLRFVHMLGEQVHQLRDTFDYVIISQTLDEVYDLQALFRSIQAVCHARTRVVIVQQNRLWQPTVKLLEWLRIRKHVPERNWLPSDEIMHLLKLSGFETIRMFGMTLAPLNLSFLSTFVNRFVAALPLVHHLGLHYVIVARPVQSQLIDPERSRSVSIVIPACNEAGHIKSLLKRIPVLAEKQQVLFVEGGSSDNTWEVIQKIVRQYDGPFDVQCMQQEGRGKGDAVRKGFASATGDILMILDADISVPPEELQVFYDAICSGQGELINGSRMVYLMDRRAMRFLNLLANKLFGWVFTYLLSQRFRDTLCGTKVLTRCDYERLAANRSYFGDFDPFGDFDLLFGAARMNLKIVDVPVHYKARTYGETNISRFRHGLLLLRMCGFAARKIKFV